MKKRYTEEQIIGFLKEAEAGVSAKDLCRRHGFSFTFGEASTVALRYRRPGD